MLKRSALVCSWCVSVLLTSQGSGRAAAQSVPSDPTTLPLLQFSDIAYRGGFRLPAGTANGDTFEIGGGALAYNPGANSLFVSSRRGNVAEVSIPTAVDSTVASDMPFATYLQPFADPTEGHLSQIASTDVSIDSLLVAGGRLYGTASIYYDALNLQRASHYSRSLTLSEPSFRGMYSVGDPTKTGYVSGYMATVPPEWQARLGGPAVTGQCCIPIVTRTSWGPGAFAWNPADLGQVPATATPLLYYTGDHATLGHWAGSDPTYGATTQMGGLAIIAGTRTALYFGRNGTGPFCYGNGTSTMSLAGTHGPDGEIYCYDPTSDDKGQHAYPYNYQIWAYDLNDFAAVRAGQKQPWEIVPYGVWPLSLPTPERGVQIGGVGYDAARQIIYISQLRADQDGYAYRPLIHAFTVAPAAPPPVLPLPLPLPMPSTTSALVTSVTLTADKAAPQAAGTVINWSASSTGGVGPYQYKWLVYTDRWTVVNGWTTANTFAWTPTNTNPDAKVSVWVRGANNVTDVPELSQDVPFPIVAATATAPTTPVPPATPITGVALTPNSSAPQPAGTTILWSAAPAGGSGSYQYKWLVYTDRWVVVNSWTTAATFAWTPTAANPDAKVSVWVRNATNTADVPETSRDVPFPIVAATATAPTTPVPPATPITGVALTPNGSAPQPAGTTILWSAAPAGGSGSYQYKWLVYTDRWVVVNGWTTAATFAWTPMAANPDAKVSVWVRNATNTADVPETSRDVPFPIVAATATAPTTPVPPATPITGVALTPNRTAPQPAGTTILWSAAPAGGSGSYQYKWLVYTDRWVVVNSWTTAATFAWTPMAANPDAKVSVWVRNATNTADVPETSRDVPFPIVAATATVPTTPVPPATPITGVALTPNSSAPQPAGTTILWSAAPAGGSGSYQYKWLVYTDRWTVVNNWTTANTFAWTPTAANPDAKVSVWVRNATNTADVPETSRDVPFPITTASFGRVASVALAVNKIAPQVPGTTMTWSAVPTGGAAPYQYKWLVYTDRWVVVSDWSTSNTFAWTPTYANPDARVSVWVRSANNSADDPEASTSVPFVIQ